MPFFLRFALFFTVAIQFHPLIVNTERILEEEKEVSRSYLPFPVDLPKELFLKYDNGDTDHSVEFDFVVSPGEVTVAAIWDDFVITTDTFISGLKFLMITDPGVPLCHQYSPSFHFFRGNQTSYQFSYHGTLFVRTSPILDEAYENMHYLILTFAKTKFYPDHYWFKLSMFCEESSRAFLLTTSNVKNSEARVEGPTYSGPISEGPFGQPPHDFAFALFGPLK